MNVSLTREEISITIDVLSLVLNDPDWQELATATDSEWNALASGQLKMLGALNRD